MKTLFHTPEFQTPDEVSLLEFFEAEPIVAPQDGFWCYEVTDSDHLFHYNHAWVFSCTIPGKPNRISPALYHLCGYCCQFIPLLPKA